MITEINIRNLPKRNQAILISVRNTIYTCTFELHKILSQCTSFVREYIAYFPELLIQVRGINMRRYWWFVITHHFCVRIYQLSLKELNHFQTD